MAKGLNTTKASADNPHRQVPKRQKAANMRDKSTIKRLNMYRNSGAIRNKAGKVVGGTLMMKGKAGGQEITRTTGRIQPDRRWFGNTRVVGQKELDKFRNEMSLKAADPYSVVLRTRKLPMGLVQEAQAGEKGAAARMKLLETETYDDVFNGKRSRKRAKIESSDLSALLARAQEGAQQYEERGTTRDRDAVVAAQDFRDEVSHDVFSKGQSKRIWGELYKVLDCSDVVIQVLDARNVPGTRCEHVERHIRKNASHKHLIFVINKCDLVPNWVTKRWVQKLSETTPTLAFHASMSNPFGKGALINLLRQFAKLHQDKKQISVGLIGYPNVGKSSVINALRKKKVCKVAPIPGETKVWQYITLMRRIFLIDCPGIVYDTGDDEVETVLKGVVRAERLPQPTDFIPAILERVKKEYLVKVYGVDEWRDEWHFLEQLATKSGKLLPKGEADFNNVAVQVINDFQRGKIPWFAAPPMRDEELRALEQSADGAVPLNEAEADQDEAVELDGDEEDEDVEEDDDEEKEPAGDDEEKA
jgi:nuclear GTP-binding protein